MQGRNLANWDEIWWRHWDAYRRSSQSCKEGWKFQCKLSGIFLWEAAVALSIKTQNPASLYLQGKAATSLHTFTATGHLIPGKGTILEKNIKKDDATLSARGPGYQSWYIWDQHSEPEAPKIWYKVDNLNGFRYYLEAITKSNYCHLKDAKKPVAEAVYHQQ